METGEPGCWDDDVPGSLTRAVRQQGLIPYSTETAGWSAGGKVGLVIPGKGEREMAMVDQMRVAQAIRDEAAEIERANAEGGGPAGVTPQDATVIYRAREVMAHHFRGLADRVERIPGGTAADVPPDAVAEPVAESFWGQAGTPAV